jgi:hypothetical protein
LVRKIIKATATAGNSVINDEKTIRENIDFILSHFENQHELFPRTIMTSKTRGQRKIEYESNVKKSIDKIFEYFKKSYFIDCKINAFPYNIEHTAVDMQAKNRTAASFIMIDLDLKDIENNSKEKLNNHLDETLKNLYFKFNEESHPTVLWTGNGYHIYQPIKGIVFEKYKIFYDFLLYVDNKDLTTEFLRFAKKLFTNGKDDPKHLPSIKSCLVRVPGTLNSKNNQKVQIIQKWDGNSPAIQWITSDFRDYLLKKKTNKISNKEINNKKKEYYNKKLDMRISKIIWIEKLLQTPIEDGRKQCLWQILCPYLINIRKLTKENATNILNQWLQRCDKVKKIDFDSTIYIKSDLKNVKEYLPPSKEKLKNQYPEIYNILKCKKIIA